MKTFFTLLLLIASAQAQLLAVGKTASATCSTPSGSNFTESFGDSSTSCWAAGPTTCDHTWTIGAGTAQAIVTTPAGASSNTACANSLQYVIPSLNNSYIDFTFTAITGNFDLTGSIQLESATFTSNTDSGEVICFSAGIGTDCDSSGRILGLAIHRVSSTQYALKGWGSTSSSVVNITKGATGAWHTFTLHRDTTVASCSLVVDGGSAQTFTCNAGNPAAIFFGTRHFQSSGAATWDIGNVAW